MLKTGYWDLVGRGEPYRLLFPLGTLLGVVGVGLWPVFVWLGGHYPMEAHAGLMIQGFVAAYVIGFLGTALPRLLDVRRVGLCESAGYTVGLVGVSVFWLLGQSTLANGLFLLVMLGFCGALICRAHHRQDNPPPGFALVAMGLLSALVGTVLVLIDQHLTSGLPGEVLVFAKRLLHQGFPVLPIMGVGAFLLPRFFGLPNRQDFPESLTLPPGWWPRALFALVCGLAVVGSFALEAWGWWRVAFGLRAAAILVYFLREVPVHQATFAEGSLAWGLRIAMFSIPVGYLAMMLFPVWQTGLVHVVFISGISLLIFVVGTRVVFGHGGQSDRFGKRLLPIVICTWLFLLAMLTRVTADWMPDIRMTHYGYAAVVWIVAVVIWALYVLPKIRASEPE